MSVDSGGTDAARATLYEIMREDVSFEEKANRALELGEAYLGVQNAHLTRIDPRIDFWEAIASTDPPDGDFPAGDILDLQTTYCRRVGEKGSTIALSDAPNEGWSDDPAFREHGLHCYHGTPLIVEGEVWGTLCFVSDEPRAEPFDRHETLFAELIARLLEHELRLARQESEVNLQANLIGVLSRVLRHNLRNDLNVIRGQLSLMAERGSGPLLEDLSAINKIDKLVDLANTARKIESVATSDLDRQPVEVNVLLENVIERVRRNHPNASYGLEGSEEEVFLEAIPSLRTGLEELIENAAKHGGAAPEVTVTLARTTDAIEIEVIDNGPGLPAHEREVLREGSETPLIHGSGLGLWLAYWIIANHNGSIQTDVTDSGTCITVRLPRATTISEFTDSEALLSRFHREHDKFEAVFEESFDGIVLIDDDGHYTDVNESAADLFGLSAEALRGRSITEFVPDSFDIEAAWTALMSTDRERDTFTLVRADGTERIVEYTAVTDVIPGQHLAVLRDVSERIAQERELLETNDRLEAIIDASPDPILVLDADGSIQVWNEAAEGVFGHDAADVIGERLQDLGLYPDGESEEFVERFDRALAGERFENLVISRPTDAGDGVLASLSTAPLHDSSGSVSGIVAVAQDITGRIERGKRFEALSKGFPDLCFVIDEDGRYRDVLTSPASQPLLLGDPDDLVGRTVNDVLPSEEGQMVMERINRTIESGESQQFQFELRLSTGPQLLEARTHPLSESDGGKQLVSMVVRDITDPPDGGERARAT